jgi:hypothetical protein
VLQTFNGAQLRVHAIQVYKQSVHAVQVYTPQRDDWHTDNTMQELERKGNWDQQFSRKTVTHWGVTKRNILLNKFKKENKRSLYISSQNVNQYKTKLKQTQIPAGVQSKQTVQLSLICYQDKLLCFHNTSYTFRPPAVYHHATFTKNTSKVTNTHVYTFYCWNFAKCQDTKV